MGYLVHFQRLGAKHGVRNGTKYPLTFEDLSAAEREHPLPNGNMVSEFAESQKQEGKQSKAAEKRLARKDSKWLKKQDRTTTKKLQKKATKSKYMKSYDRQLRSQYKTRNSDGSLNKNYVAAYNQRLAEYMNMTVKDVPGLESPSGLVLRFVAKRGDVGVYSAMASADYDMSLVKRGVNAEGKVAYKKQYVDQLKED